MPFGDLFGLGGVTEFRGDLRNFLSHGVEGLDPVPQRGNFVDLSAESDGDGDGDSDGIVGRPPEDDENSLVNLLFRQDRSRRVAGIQSFLEAPTVNLGGGVPPPAPVRAQFSSDSDFKAAEERDESVAKQMGEECPVCRDVMDDRSVLWRTACGHLFCKDCIVQWMEAAPVGVVHGCPMCKTPLDENKPNKRRRTTSS